MTKKTYVFQVTETRTIECEYGVEADDLAEAHDLAKIGYTTWEYENKHTMKVINHEVGRCNTSGLSRQGPYIVLTIRGPKGGTRACESLSIEEAEKLVHLLTEALAELRMEAAQ